MRLLATLLPVLLLASCAAGGNPYSDRFDEFSLEALSGTTVEQQIGLARADLDAGHDEDAFLRLRSLWGFPDLLPEGRDQVELLLERCADGIISSHALRPGHLKALFKDELPRRVQVAFGVAAAEAMLERGRRLDAWRMIDTVETRFPNHHLRGAAGSIVARAGLSLAADRGRTLFIFPVRENAPQVLEYLVLNHPSAPECAEAYAALGRLYEEERLWQLAIDRHQDLLVYHPDSPQVPRSEARIPHLRLERLKRPVYSRGELVQARAELEAWLLRHEGDELEPSVRADLEDCLRRLSDSDASIARFYDRVDEDWGARIHAERALVEARAAEDPERVEAIEALLRKLPPADAAESIGGASR